MKRAGVLWIAAALAVAGCAGPKTQTVKSVREMPPGYGVMVATFRFVPGESKFPQSQIIYDAKYVCGRLAGIGYQPFIAYNGGNSARVGVRASTHTIAEAFRKTIERVGYVDFGAPDNYKLKVAKCEIVNLAELCPGAVDTIQ